MAPPTILAHKSSFLTAQTLQLSQSLAPSAAWRASNSSAAEGGLSDRVVDEVIYRANHALQQHARRVYAPQASRHVAEQIEALYLEAAEKAVRGDGGRGAGGNDEEDGEGATASKRGDEEARFLRVGADFASDEVISTLPSAWDLHSPSQAEAHPSEAHRYADLAASLISLSARRREGRARLDRLRRMRTLLSPLTSGPHSQNDEAGRGGSGIDKVQPNLVARDGELEKELERMRVLLVRVAGRVAQLPDPDPRAEQDAVVEDLEALERGKVDRLLDGF
ncbi:kinetochore Sim4 complex subunit Fta4 [Hypoxylon sp. FL0543]|nr:kinetochore Sim4 complex subunit Fta4 [Hypoxylon sp. FL0543]